MAHPSVITFPYNGSIYTAEVQQMDSSLSIFVPDQRLHDLLPEGRATISLKQGIQLNDQQITPQQDLILSILGAIES